MRSTRTSSRFTGLGFFSNVSAHVVQQGGQNVLVYYVKERPQITDVKFYGMKAIRSNDDKIVAATKLHPGTILNPVAVKETINDVTAVYADKGYTDAKVTFKAIPQPDNTAFGEFDVVEGSKVEITKIQFVGNHAFSSTVLANNMETRPYSKLLSWITGWGALDPKKLQEDVDRLTAFYYDNGYLNVQIAPPQIIRNAEKITIVINIDEGTPYRVGRIDIEGNLKFPRRELRKQLTMKSGQLFRGSSLQRQVLALSDFYSNRGYAYVNVDPRTTAGPRQQAGQRGVRDQSRSRSADRPHQYQRQHQDLGQGNSARDPGAGAGAVQRRGDPRFADASATAGILQRHAHHDCPGVAARQDKSERERDRGEHRVVPGGGRFRQLSIDIWQFHAGQYQSVRWRRIVGRERAGRLPVPELQYQLHRAVVPGYPAGRGPAVIRQQNLPAELQPVVGRASP